MKKTARLVWAWLADRLAIPIYVFRLFKRNKSLRKILFYAAILCAALRLFLGMEAFLYFLMFAMQIAFSFVFMIVQFVGIFWFLSRPRTITIRPGDKGGLSLGDYWGQPALVELTKQWVTILQGDEAFRAMGGEPIRGLLLEGAPGTGKTYLMKCLGGSAGVALHGIEGSSFRAMFWGVDVLRVLSFIGKCRKLAAEDGACIAYIDEIDSVGASRGGVTGGGQGQMVGPMGFMGGTGALTTLLAQMDGIEKEREMTTCRNIARRWLGAPPVNEGFVLFVGATNRPDVLDPALIRPGRLDRVIRVDPPDGPGRREIFSGYLTRIKHGEIDVDYLVANTQGMTPAAIAMAVTRDSVRNARFRNAAQVEQIDLEMALMEQITGMANPIGDLEPAQQRQIACHEAGHAVISHYQRPDMRVAFVSIVRRGSALGLMLPVNVKATYTIPLTRIVADIRVALAGDIATKVCLGERWTGAMEDLRLVRDRVLYLAWHGVFGPVLTISPVGELPKTVAEQASRWLTEQWEETERLCEKHKDSILTLADALVEKGELTGEEALKIIEQEKAE